MEFTFFPLYTEIGQKCAEDHLICLYTSPKAEFVSRTVLILAGIGLIFLLSSENSAMFWIQYGNWYEMNVDNTLIISAVDRKSRTF